VAGTDSAYHGHPESGKRARINQPVARCTPCARLLQCTSPIEEDDYPGRQSYEALRTASYIQPTGPEVDLRIENENILKHEAPVCLELNEQVRWQYWDNKKPN
jgi:hypothetical protein